MSLPSAGIALGLGSAAGLGIGDFLGGFAARRRAALRVVLAAHAAGLAITFLIILIQRSPVPPARPLIMGAAAGLIGAVSTVVFYFALSRGRMGPTSMISAILSAAVPVLFHWAFREAPTPLRLAGILVGFGAVVLLTAEKGPSDRVTLVLAALSGIGFGLFLLLVAEAGTDYGVWPILMTRLASVAGLLVVGSRMQRGGAEGVPWLGAAAGACDSTANILYVYALRWVTLDVASMLAALYPAFTIALAILVLGERPTRLHWLGFVAAVVAVLLLQA